MSSEFPEVDAVLRNQALFGVPPKVSVHALPDRTYLEQTVLPLLLHGLEATAKERPLDPLEFLAAYLISNNPQRDDVLPQPPNPMLYGAGFAVVSAVQSLKAKVDIGQGSTQEAAAPAATVPSTAASQKK